ncbi:hypothetical protein R6Q59_030035 [Mikania micrantha]|uniref:Uncharacterized protein n=1 Tax=Mikania micrantha TaxID=192012 RepID=A0A5N6LSH3_9ASTR|nr:hypothetical protein E3N88_37886 [Mikania micrantha]
MFLVEKTHLTSPFKLIAKKPSPISKNYQLAARSFDEKVILHLKTLIPASDSSNISLSWMSKAVSFLSMIHLEAQDQISNLRSESDYYQDLYMDYSQKVLDLCNLISSAVQQLVDRRLLFNLSLRLINVNSSGQIPSPEKLKKAKDTLIRSVHHTQQTLKDKAQRAKDLLKELTLDVNSLPIGKTGTAKDMIRRTLHGLGALTVILAGVLVSVLYGPSDLVKVRVPADFPWADSVTGVQKQVFDLIKPKEATDGGEEQRCLSELEDTVNRARTVCDILDEVTGDGEGNDKDLVRLEDGRKELSQAAAKFSDGVDKLTNGVNGLFSSVLKTRNGVLDGVRKCDW